MHRARESMESGGYQGPHFLDATPTDRLPAGSEPLAWEEVSPGRYMPRRVRGSFLGRALG